MDLSPVAILALVGFVFGAAIVNGTIGFGFALLVVNALAVALGAKDGIIVLSLLTPFVSGLLLWHHRAHRAIARRLKTLVLGGLAGTVIGTQILVVLPGYAISIALGLFTVFDVLIEMRGKRPPLASKTETRLAPIAGLVGGVSNGALGASGPVFGSYLLAIGLRGAEFALAISVVFFVMSITRNIALAWLGQYTPAIMVLAAVLLIPAIVGLRVGTWLRGRLPARTVERAVLVVLLLASLNLLYRGVEGWLVRNG